MAKYANGSSNFGILWLLIELSCICNQFRFWFCKNEIVILWHSMPVQIKVIACSQVRRAVRATLILFPLLGMTNLLFFINPKVSFASYPTFFSLFCLSFSSLSSISFLSSLALSTFHHCLILKIPQLTLKVERFQNLNIPEHQYIYMVVNSVLRSSQVRAKIWKTEEILNLFQQEPLLFKKIIQSSTYLFHFLRVIVANLRALLVKLFNQSTCLD